MKERTLAFFAAASAALVGPGCVLLGTSVDPGELGLKYIVLDEPALQTELRREGFYFQWPWNTIIKYDVTWQSRTEKVDVLTADDLHVPTEVSVTYRVRPTELYAIHTQIGVNYYEDVVQAVFVTLVRDAFAQYSHNDLSREGGKIESLVLDHLRRATADKPIDIDRVAIRHIDYDQRVTESISEKLAKEQEVEQKRSELEIAKQEAEIVRTVAAGQGDAKRIEAEAEAQSIVILGEAQSKAQAAISKTLSKGYLQFKAFDGGATTYYFVPTGKDGLPILVNAGSGQ